MSTLATTSRRSLLTRERVVAAASWAIAAWICYVFIVSLFYKFAGSPDTVHIFSTIGAWLGTFLGTTLGALFARFGAYGVGSFELATSLVLLSPIALGGAAAGRWTRARAHAVGGLMASLVMTGAVFFHLASPLGIVVLDHGKSDGGSLFRAAVSILALGLVTFAINRRRAFGAGRAL